MVYIKSVLPNPIGRDGDGEWIRIANGGDLPVGLSEWRIEDESSREYSLSGVGVLQPGEVVELRSTATDIVLNNDGDTVFLYERNILRDTLSYSGPSIEGEVVLKEGISGVSPEMDEVSLASISQSGPVNLESLQKSLWEPIFLGLVVAALAAGLFVYLSFNILADE